LLGAFLGLERERAGWRFWLLWVIATNVGFFPGLALGTQLSAAANEPLASAIVGASFGALAGVAQWLVLRRHLVPSHHWTTATAFGWCVGAGLGALLLTRFAPDVVPGGVRWTLFVGFFAGAVIGVPQRRILRRFSPSLSAWWVPISSLAWGLFFPGVISGLFLAHRLGAAAEAPAAPVVSS
jgi:hypothetical protein